MLYYIINNFGLSLYCVGSFSAFSVPTWEGNKASWEAVCLESGVLLLCSLTPGWIEEAVDAMPRPYKPECRVFPGVRLPEAALVSPDRQVTWLF